MCAAFEGTHLEGGAIVTGVKAVGTFDVQWQSTVGAFAVKIWNGKGETSLRRFLVSRQQAALASFRCLITLVVEFQKRFTIPTYLKNVPFHCLGGVTC